MKDEINKLINKSERGLKSAQSNCSEGDYDFSVSRAYYAMFYITEALLLTKQLSTSKHSGILALFFEHFIKPGIFDKELHKALHKAFDLRQQGDYWSDPQISKELAEQTLLSAKQYINILKKHILNV